MSWGYRVTLVTFGFVGFMTFLVISSFRQNFDLVAEDYYSKELKFGSQMEKQNNQNHLADSMTCVVNENNIILKFPDDLLGKKIEGEILFFRPSDAKKDFKRSITTSGNGIQLFNKDLFTKGQYRIQVDYRVEGVTYYFEKSVMIH